MDNPTDQSRGLPIPRSRFCSDDVPANDSFEVWSESISLVFDPFLAPGVAPADFSVYTDAFLLEETMLCRASASGIGGYRNPGNSPTRDVADLFIVHYFRRGGFAGYNGAQTLKVNSGDSVILDTTRGFSLAGNCSDVITAIMPRRALLDALGNSINLYPRVIPGKTLPGKLLGHTLLSTWKELPQHSMSDSAAVRGLLIGAIAGLIRGADKSTEDPAVDNATLNAICAYIERNLTNPELGPDHLCKQFCCSRARLYRLFAPLDGVANYIRSARLERCHATLLATPAKVNISDVAMEWGFSSISHFNRLFREIYGVSPSEIRGLAHKLSTSPFTGRTTPRLWIPEYRNWLARL